MGERGRKSAASLAVISGGTERPEPPEDLTPGQAEEWRAIVKRLPADWFPRETHALLANFCRHVTAARFISRLRSHFEPDWCNDAEGLERFNKLSLMAERESRALATLATKLRISQQAQRTPGAAGTAARKSPGARRPWRLTHLTSLQHWLRVG